MKTTHVAWGKASTPSAQAHAFLAAVVRGDPVVTRRTACGLRMNGAVAPASAGEQQCVICRNRIAKVAAVAAAEARP